MKIVPSRSFLVRRCEAKKRNVFTLDSLIVAWIIILIIEISKGQDFRIDNQLRIIANDCYTRIAIGSRLPQRDVIMTMRGNSLSDCETFCTQNRTTCNAFSFGVDARGNGTCIIGRMDVNARGKDFLIDPDYDVYERRPRMPKGCQHDRLLRIGYNDRRTGTNSSNSTMTSRQSGGINSQRSRPTNPFGNIFSTGSPLASQQPSFIRGGWYSPIADDGDTRLYDVLTNKNNYKPKPTYQSTLDDISLPHHFFHSPDFHASPTDTKFHDPLPDTVSTWNLHFPSFFPSSDRLSYTTPRDSPEHETRTQSSGSLLFGHPVGIGSGVDSLLEKTRPCYRKLLVGKRLSEDHVRRTVRCDRIEECHRVCEYESTFVCEGFNYGRMQHDGNDDYGVHKRPEQRGRNMCQLTSMSGSRMDPRRDFLDDSRYDYYERDWRCPAEKTRGDFGRLDWSSQAASRRPVNSWQRQPSPPQSLDHHPRVPNEIATAAFPRPFVPDREVHSPENTGYRHREKVRPYLDNRPSYHDYDPPYVQRPRPYNEISYERPQQYLPNYHRPPETSYGRFPIYSDRRNGETTNDILPKDWRRPGDRDDWPISRVYGPSYGYQTNRYPGKWPSPKPTTWKPTNERRYYNYDQNYGPAYGYDNRKPVDSYIPGWKSQHRQQWIGSGGSRDCSVRSVTGFKIARKCIVTSYATNNLEECEMLCSRRDDCRSFAYRYSLAATAPTDNCLLSNIHFAKLDFYTDLEPDRDYDVYAIIGDPRDCRPPTKIPSNEEVRPHRRPAEECFWRVQSGFGMPSSLTRKVIRVDNGLGECQIACIASRLFTCRSFVFRYDSERDREPNCFLSDCPTSEIIPTPDSNNPLQNRQCELYERGSYGRGCEAYPFATIYNTGNFGKTPPSPQPSGNRQDEGCYSGYDGGCKLSPYAVSSVSRVDSENECRRQCSRMRYNQHSPCMSFSFKLGDEKRGDNCYLSDVPRRDLRPGLDYTYDDDYVMYAWKELEPQCSSIPGPPPGYPQNDGFHGIHGIHENPGTGVYLPADGSRPPLLGPGPGLISYNHLFLGVRPIDPDRPDPVPSPHYPPTSPPGQYNEPGFSFGPGISAYPHEFGSFNRHYTVNGYPCKRGTKCERNEIAGFWSCEPEGDEFGSWDYCCEPNHHCGFSQGYRYPWCYVGPSEDQWRPCSDEYYPYLPSPRPAIKPSSYHDHRRPGVYDTSLNPHYHGDDVPIFNSEDPTAYRGRHWPIAFLHPVPPPNASSDSIAEANHRRDDNPTATSRINPDANPNTSTSDVPPPETINSSITRLQLHKSHLKRRGLVSTSNRTRTNSKYVHKSKIHRISIIPVIPAENEKKDIARSPELSQLKINNTANGTMNYSNSTSLRNNEENVTTTRVNNNDLDVFLTGNLTNGRRKIGLGRVERVTKAMTKLITDERKNDN